MALFETRKTRKALLAGAAAVATLGAAWAVYEETMRPGPLEAMIPESAFAFTNGDARWMWDATDELREGPQIRAGLAEMEKELGVSLEEDVVPWAGQVAGAMLSMDPKQPQSAFFIEVRNPIQYYATMTRMRTRMEREASRYWKGTGYNGVPLRYSYLGSGKNRIPVSTAWLKGWLVVGVGNGATKRVIDTWQDRKPSLADNSVWANALGQLPEQSVMRFGVNTGMMAQAGPAGMVAMSTQALEMSRAVSAGGLTELDDGFRMVSSTIATAPASRRFYGALSTVPTVKEAVLDRLPDGTFFTFAITDPGAWWDAYEPMFSGILGADAKTREAQEFVDVAMARYEPLTDIIRRFEEGMALGLTYRPERGFGLTLVGDCGTMETARQSADELAGFVRKFDQEVTLSEDGSTYRIPLPEGKAPIPFQPSWTVSGEYLVLGSHDTWLEAGTGAERIPLSDEARTAQVVSRGDFRFVEPALTQFAPPVAAKKGPSKDDVIQGWRRSGLGEARWWSTSEMRGDGTTHGVGELRNWNWRAALRAFAEQQRAQTAKAAAR